MNGAKRVVIFCLLTAALPTILIIIPLYLRHNVFADVTYEVHESDVLEVGRDISSIFCQDHILKMNASFNAFQVENKPEISTTRKHIRLKKGMRLPDDTLEYWGFFLQNGSSVRLSVCSRYDGSRILVVKGEKNLKTCGLLDHTQSKVGVTNTPTVSGKKSPVRVRFEVDENELLNESNKWNESSTRKGRSVDEANNAEEDEEEDVDETRSGESEGLRTYKIVREFARKMVAYRKTQTPRTFEESVLGHKLRHARSHAVQDRNEVMNKGVEMRLKGNRKKRLVQPVQPHNLDAKTVHGGNAQNHVEDENSSDESSFENSLLTCYGGDILLQQEFPPSQMCQNVNFLIANQPAHMTTTHNVTENGYYYYIFYSDNDLVENDIYAVFDIQKPTYQLSNVTNKCINETTCSFPIPLLSNEVVVVEVPMRDGIEHEEEDISHLVSVCQPRMAPETTVLKVTSVQNTDEPCIKSCTFRTIL